MIVKGKKIDLLSQIPCKKNQTISKRLSFGENHNIFLFSMYKGTDISSEIYKEYKIYFILQGFIKIENFKLIDNDFFIVKPFTAFSIKAHKNSVFLEISLNLKGEKMKNLDIGKVICLKDEIDYVSGGISNLDIASGNGVKIMLLAFDENQSLRPHSAPGDALVVPLEGKAKALVDKDEFEIEAGNQIIFPKNITHNVAAITKFKMMLILVIN